jgi:HPt (histidine-containing phosphotransfer) domain-containing protein
MEPLNARRYEPAVPQPFDLDALSSRCMENPSVVLMVLDEFEAELRSEISEFQRHLAAADAARIAAIAHSLKGAAGTAGTTTLHRLAEDCELLAKQGDLDRIGRLLPSMISEMNRCLDSVPAARAKVAASREAPSTRL